MRVVLRALGVLVAIVGVRGAVLYGGSEWTIRRGHSVPLEQVPAFRDAASIAEGGRLAFIFGCRSCHGSEGQGQVLFEAPWVGRAASPALARVAASHSDAELARAVRHGVRKDGTTLWVMPTNGHNFIADDDMGRLIAWMRSLKPGPKDQLQPMAFAPIGRWMILSGSLPPSLHPGTVAEKTRPADVGRYFVDVSCMGCHALDKERPTDDGTQIAPALAPMGAAYDLPAFTHLLRTGIGKSGRDLGLMREIAPREFGRTLTDAEIEAIHDYLTAEAARLK